MGRITDVAPAGLVPAAWLVTAGAHAAVVSERTLFIALVVMDVFLLAFFLASLGEMTGILKIWQAVIVVGLLANLAGTADMALDLAGGWLVAATLYAWMLLPGLAYLPTGRAHDDATLRGVYLGVGVLSLLGVPLYALGHLGSAGPSATLGGLALVGLGQTAGIATAVVQNTGGALR